MTNKTTKRALFTSVMSLIICVVMLMGTTFAWFTDSVASGKNKIVAGNLDVELYYQNDTVTDWKKVDADTNVFKADSLWEPGHTEVVKLKVVNEGTLALKYLLNLAVVSEIGGVNVDGDDFKLSDYIKYGTTSDAVTSREGAIDAVEAGAQALSTAASQGGTLLSEKEKELTLVVYMPETVGNEANYRGDAIPTIDFGIELLATQVENESDSFGIDYDANATYPAGTYYVNNGAEFADVLNAITNDDSIDSAKIVLNDDIVWETGAGIGSTPVIPEDSSLKNLTIYGNGNTLTATGKGVGALRAANGGTLILEDIVVEDESKSYNESAWELTYLEFAGKLNFKNVTFNSGIMVSADNAEATTFSLRSTPAYTATFTDCTFNTKEDSVYGVWVDNGAVLFTGCTFTGTRGLKMAEIYSNSNIDNVTVDNCLFADITKKPGIAIGSIYQKGETAKYGNQTWTDNSDTTVVITNNTFKNCQAGDQGLYIYETDTPAGAWLTEENNTVKLDVSSATITAGTTDATGNSLASKIRNIVFGTPAEYPEIVASNTPVRNENGTDVYQVADGNVYDVYYLSDAKIALPEDSRNLFADMKNMTEFDATNLDMSNVENALCMFVNCSNLTTIEGVEDWDVSNVTNMQSMFYGCNKLEDMDLSSWDTSNVTNMRMVFFRCYELTDETYDSIENWDVSNVKNFYSMFKHARGLKTLDLSKWDTSSATNMSHMFANIGDNLTSLDLSSFDTSNVTDMSWMFYSANKLETIYVGDGWSTESVDPSTPTCFYNNQALVGGNGTTWLDVCDMANAARPWESSAKIIYAVADGEGTPGLLTYKAN